MPQELTLTRIITGRHTVETVEYSVLVKRVVSLRIDGIRDYAQRAAIQRTVDLRFHEFFDRDVNREIDSNPDGSPIILRYIEDGEESNCYLVDEAGDEEFSRSQWYASDGTTPLEPGKVCGECARPRDGVLRRWFESLRRAMQHV